MVRHTKEQHLRTSSGQFILDFLKRWERLGEMSGILGSAYYEVTGDSGTMPINGNSLIQKYFQFCYNGWSTGSRGVKLDSCSVCDLLTNITSSTTASKPDKTSAGEGSDAGIGENSLAPGSCFANRLDHAQSVTYLHTPTFCPVSLHT